jgi:hypothetical protein
VPSPTPTQRDPASSWRNNDELVQLIRVIDQDSAQIRKAALDRGKAESKYDHSRMGLLITEDQIAEILVVG